LQGTPLLTTPSSTSSYVVMRTPSENYPDAFDMEDHDCWRAPLPTSTLVSTPKVAVFRKDQMMFSEQCFEEVSLFSRYVCLSLLVGNENYSTISAAIGFGHHPLPAKSRFIIASTRH
jgi:hypothetical protein